MSVQVSSGSLPYEEQARSAALHRFQIMDSAREEEFDDIAAIAAEVCQTPIAVVNFIDTERQFFKAEVGLGVRETPLDTSFCGKALLAEDMMIVPDATQDSRFDCNPLVTQDGGLRFYAGALLKTRDGFPIGTVCVLDTKPRLLDEHQIRTLRLLARQAMIQLELRTALAETRRVEARHRQVLDSSIDYAIISTDLDGNVTGWNRGAENVLGWSEDEMLGNPAAIIFNPIDRVAEIPRLEMEAAREEGRGADERWHLRKDGSRFFALGEMMPLRNEVDRHVGYVKIVRDRTSARREAQRLALLTEVSGALLKGDDPAGTIRPILESGADTIGFDQSYLYDVAPDGQRLLLRHSVGASEELRMVLQDVPLDVPLCGIVAERVEPVILTNLQDTTEPRLEIGRSLGLRAFAGYPLRVKGKLVGVISFGSAEHGRFDDDTLSFFQTVTGLLAVARERADDAQALRDAEQRSRLAQQAGGIGTFELDAQSDEVVPSAEFCRIFGVPFAPRVPAAAIEDLVVGEDTPLQISAIGLQSVGAPAETEHRIRRANDQQLRWIVRRAEYLRDDTGRILSMYGTVQDITQKKVAALRQEALLRLGNEIRHARSREEMAKVACDALIETLEVTRAGYARVDRRAGLYSVIGERVADGIVALHGSYKLSDFERTTARLSSGDILVLRNVETDEVIGADIESYSAIGIAAQISIPLIAKGELIGSLFVHQQDARDWTDGEIDFVRRVADRLYAALATAKAEEEQAVLNHELSHRLKNSLSMVQAIASQTLRTSTNKAALRDFLQRIQALSTAHNVLLFRDWEAGAIAETVRATLANIVDYQRMVVEGPTIELGPKSTLTLSMMLHELATNALKYGAFSVPEGRVHLRWCVEDMGNEDRDLVIIWEEVDGPPVQEPVGSGFGSRLISLGLTGTGGVEVSFRRLGLVVKIRAPFSEVQQS